MIAHNVPGGGPQVRPSNDVSAPGADPAPEEVRGQLQRILASSVFHNSKRYAAVLKFIVDQTLQGFGDRLKERTIGIEVFDRPPDYDTATDHVVRSAVAEVRKRLAQYYQQDGRGELRIEVLPGSYMPQFKWAEEHAAVSVASPTGMGHVERAGTALPGLSAERAHHPAWLRPRWIIAVCAVLAVSAAVFLPIERSQDALDRFWNPILSSRAPVLLCIGNVEGGQRPPEQDPVLSPTLSLSDFHNSPSETVNVHDAFTVAKFAGFLESHGRQFQLASQSDATYTDLQNGPTILVGLLNNGWTVRLVEKLRFTVDQPTVDKITIRDRQNPSNLAWSIDYSTPYLNLTRDYALVLRMVDPKTEQTVVVAAGVTVFGTIAAGDLLTNPHEMKKLAAIAPPGWEKKNMELVLSTDVIRGRSGPATILAAQFW
ncbi:MAG TPA: hypothetical protein VJQ82_08610 [Terriglobales bacterium]|nr:hypothetical protein [Terriglobales bacterium]